jgi:integrase
MAGLIGGKRMARSKFQEGSMFIEGEGAKKKYVVRFRVYDADGGYTKKKVSLGLVSSLSKRDANRLRMEAVTQYTAQLPKAQTNKAEMSFETFYNERFLPLKTHWGEPHRESFRYIMDDIVMPKFGALAIGAIDKVMVQALLNSLVPSYSESSVSHVRRKMVEVFEEAVEQEFINRNPASRTKMPAGARKPEKPILTVEQLIGFIDRLNNTRDRAIFLTGTFCAMRSSELFGLPWTNFHESDEEGESYFLVDQIAYRGKRHNRTKTDASKARVPIAGRTLEALLQWKKESPDTSPDALIFPSTNKNGRSRKGAPMYPATWLQKKIQPIATALGVKFHVNFRALRRTASTLLQDNGDSLASAQSLLRHASPMTTATIYTQPIPESVKMAVNDYEDRVFAARPKPPKPPKLTRVK